MIQIAITNEQRVHPVDEERMRKVVRMMLEDEGIRAATLSLAIVDDSTIHRLNREYLQHDEPTDVLSFVLDEGRDTLDGEVIASAETAAATAARFGWTTGDELLLYVVHGTLHLLGYDDAQAAELAEMRDRERHYLTMLGLTLRYDEGSQPGRVITRPGVLSL